MTFRRAADLAVNLPAGSELWQATGGARAWSDMFSGLMVLNHGLDILAWQQTEDGSKGRNAPKAATPPPLYVEEDKKIETRDAKAEAFMRRQQMIAESRAKM